MRRSRVRSLPTRSAIKREQTSPERTPCTRDAISNRLGDGDVYDVSFTQKMTLQGGEYLLSMSCTGFEGEEHVVYHRLYNIANITVISNKNTVGVYDMESEVETSLTRA